MAHITGKDSVHYSEYTTLPQNVHTVTLFGNTFLVHVLKISATMALNARNLSLKSRTKGSKKSKGMLLYSPHMSVDDGVRDHGSFISCKKTAAQRKPVTDTDTDIGVSWINLKRRPSVPKAAQSQGIHWDDVKYKKTVGNHGGLSDKAIDNAQKLQINTTTLGKEKEESNYVPSVRPPTKVRIIPMPDDCKSEKSKREMSHGGSPMSM